MNVERPFRICWTQQSATAIFKTEALEGDDATRYVCLECGFSDEVTPGRVAWQSSP